ncbi:MAG: GtrA family protein [Anaerolineales bacterium]
MAQPDRLRREAGRFTKFSVVGTAGAIVDFGGFNLFHAVLGLAALTSSMLSFGFAVANNFLWNRYWTYPDSRSKPLGRQAGQFALVSLAGLGIRTLVFASAEGPAIEIAVRGLPQIRQVLPSFHLPAAVTPDLIGRNLTLALAVVVVLSWNFLANRIWTYSDAR